MSESSQTSQTYTFKAETRQLLNILIHSLYKEREVFLRELLSNASDALNRIRFELLTNPNALDSTAELAIHIKTDAPSRTLTIQDTGIGMTREEVIENLGTIAQSGARKFIQAAQEQQQDFSQLIGQFGVGFYSVFMVAEWVRVTSRSFQPDAQAVTWYATGEDQYQIEPAEMITRGTKIEVKLKEDAAEFLEDYRLKSIIHKHSDYIGFPIYVGDDATPVNKQTSLWRSSKQAVTPEQYKEFYRQLTLEMEEPLLHAHLVTDAPVQLYALLYIPAKNDRGVFSLRREDGIQLYSRNILIDDYNKDLLPEYLRFVQGVVDSEDLPLNVSRETIQSSTLIQKLKKVLASQVLKELDTLAKNDPDKFITFWQEFGFFLKQGIASESADTDKITPLLRFKTSFHQDSWSSLDDLALRLPPEQKEIYYIIGEDLKSVLRSPHLDYYQTHNIEVLLLTDPIDSFMLMGLHEYKEHPLKNIAQTEVQAPEDDPNVENQPTGETADELIERFKKVLGERVSDVRASQRLTQSVVRLVDPEGAINPELQRVYRYLGKEYDVPRKILELNPTHPLLLGLLSHPTGSELEFLVIEQLYESALLIEGLHPDPSAIAPRIQKIIEAALQKQN